MHGAQNTCLNACILSAKNAHAPMHACNGVEASWCRSFFAMETIANLSWVLYEHLAGCLLPPALLLSRRKSGARRCSLKKSVQIHASSWRGPRCGVAQASFDHSRLWLSAQLGLSTNPHKCAFRPMTIYWKYFHTSLFTSRRDGLKILGYAGTAFLFWSKMDSIFSTENIVFRSKDA